MFLAEVCLVKMFPGMNPRKMQQMMKRMGIKQQEIPANEVIIKSDEKEIIIENPQVSKVNMMGQETFQVVGQATEKSISTKPEISDDDIQTVIRQANCSREDALKTIKETEGDLAEAILKLKKPF